MPSTTDHIAHFNRALLRADWDDPLVAEFTENVDRVNGLAARAPGFVWRMDDDAMEAAQADPDGLFDGNHRVASTLSVWQSAEALDRFVHHSQHGRFLARRAEWFEPLDGPTYVLWPVAAGHCPTLDEALARLKQFADTGPTPEAHDFIFLRSRLDRTEAA